MAIKVSGTPVIDDSRNLINIANVGTANNSILQLDAAGKLPAIDGSQLTGIISGYNIFTRSSSYTAENLDYILTDTTSASFSVTLPSSPESGDVVVVVDETGTWRTNNLTVVRNGSTIEGNSSDFLCELEYYTVMFIYNGTTWKVFVDGLNAQVDYDQLKTDLNLATVATTGAYSDLSGTPTNYETTTELNSRDTANRARGNHTGTQSQSTVTNLTTDLAAKMPKAGGTFTGNVTFDETTETVYSLTGTNLDPANGTIQYKTLTANTTFTEALADGQSVLLRLTAGATYTVTWFTVTWVGGSAPTLTADDVLVFWQEGATVYGNYLGSVV